MKSPLSGKGILFFHQKNFQKRFFNERWNYKGTLQYFDGKEKTVTQLPVSFSLPKKENINAGYRYYFQGTLFHGKGGFYIKIEKGSLKKIDRKFSLAEKRFTFQRKVSKALKKYTNDRPSYLIMNGLATGNLQDPYVKFLFSRIGLSHLLAISGFHFGLFIAFAFFLSNLLLPRKLALLLTFFCSTLYFLFLGSNASIFRAWFMGSLYLWGKILDRNTKPLNILGATLLIELLLRPFQIENLGFQLSYLSCFGILFYYRSINRFLTPWIGSPENLKASSFLLRKITWINQFFRNSLSLTFSVNLVLIPWLLFYFHEFPLLSFFYNLFVPLIITGVLFFLFFSCFFIGFPFLLKKILFLSEMLSTLCIRLISDSPLFLHYVFYCRCNYPFLIFLYYFILFLLGASLQKEGKATTLFFDRKELAQE